MSDQCAGSYLGSKENETKHMKKKQEREIRLKGTNSVKCFREKYHHTVMKIRE